MIWQILWKIILIIFLFFVSHEVILINEEFFVVISFVLCFSFLFFTLSQTIVDYLFLRIKDIRTPFNDFLTKKIMHVQAQHNLLKKYKIFVTQYQDIVRYTLQVVDLRISELNKKTLFVIDYRFRLLLDGLLFSYIAYMEKLMRAFVKTAHSYFFNKLSKPIYFVRRRPGFVVSHVDIFKYGITEDKPEKTTSFLDFFGLGSLKTKIEVKKEKKEKPKRGFKVAHPLRAFLPIPVQKYGMWRSLLRSKRARIWFALYLRNPVLFF